MDKTIKTLHGCRSYHVRHEQVVLDFDAAELYEVELKDLVKAVVNNPQRFPGDFMFRLTPDECLILKGQFAPGTWPVEAVSPLAFTEGGLCMLSGVLKSKKAVEVGIKIIEAIFAFKKG